MVHDFDEEVVFAQDVAHCRGGKFGSVVVTQTDLGLNLARDAPARCNEAFGVRTEQFQVDPGLVVEPFDVGRRRHRKEIVHSLGCLTEHCEVRVGATGGNIVLAAIGPLDRLFVVPALRREIGLEPDYRLDIAVLGLFPHLERTKQGPVVGHRNRGHLLCHRGIQQTANSCGAVEHRVVRVNVQMDKRTRHGLSFSRLRTFSLGTTADATVRRVRDSQEVPTNVPSPGRSHS